MPTQHADAFAQPAACSADEALKQDFLDCAVRHLDELQALLLRVDLAAPCADDLDAMFRTVHSIKGGAAMFGLLATTGLAHDLESLLDAVRRGRERLSPQRVDDLLAARRLLLRQLDHDRGQHEVARADVEALRDRIRALVAPSHGVPSRAPSPAPRPAAQPAMRVTPEQVEQLAVQVGEVAALQAILARQLRGLDPSRHGPLVARADRVESLVLDLQQTVRGLRTVAMAQVFEHAPRLVRDLAERLGKDVRLGVDGGDIRIDRALLEPLVEVLVHLVRNAVDHGIEPPALRAQRSKPPHGTLMLRAVRDAGGLRLDVLDDGEGLDREAILARARSLGLACEPSWPDERIWALVFQPGFTTARAITEVSGRGVGLDAVRRTVEGLGGSVRVNTARGVGMQVSLRLPPAVVLPLHLGLEDEAARAA